MADDIFPSRLLGPRRVSESEVGTVKSAGIEDAQDLLSRPSQETLSPSFSECVGPLDRVYPANSSSLEKSTDWVLPGQGTPAVGCGKPIPRHCDHHEGSYWQRSHCLERSCPNCFERWAAKEARAASQRISWGAKTLQLRHPGAKLRLLHVVVSQSDKVGNERKARQLAYQLCRRHSIEGGAAIFHPWRREEDSLEFVPDGNLHHHFCGVNFGDVKPGGPLGELRIQVDEVMRDPARYFNSLGELLEERFLDDWRPWCAFIFKVMDDDEYGDFRGLRSQRASERLLQYLLTHAGLTDGQHALTYFGSLAYNRLPESEISRSFSESLKDGSKTNRKKPQVCPACGSAETSACIEQHYINDGRGGGLVDVQTYPEPEYASSPEFIASAERELEEDFEFRYQIAHERRERRALIKERQHARADLARRETELFNALDPLVEAWIWLKARLEHAQEDGTQVTETVLYDLFANSELLTTVLRLNRETGRIEVSPRGIVTLKREITLDWALDELHEIVVSREPMDGSDWRLERLIRAQWKDPGDLIMSDYGFVFDDVALNQSPEESK